MIAIEGLYGIPDTCQHCALSYKNRYDSPCCAAHTVEYTINPEEYKTKRMRSCPLIEVAEMNGRNVTKKYAGMIEAFGCDFSLARDSGSRTFSLDELQLKIEQGDKRMLRDIDLLKELSFGIRNGKLQIMETEEMQVNILGISEDGKTLVLEHGELRVSAPISTEKIACIFGKALPVLRKGAVNGREAWIPVKS